jgi:hypothetical protein
MHATAWFRFMASDGARLAQLFQVAEQVAHALGDPCDHLMIHAASQM